MRNVIPTLSLAAAMLAASVTLAACGGQAASTAQSDATSAESTVAEQQGSEAASATAATTSSATSDEPSVVAGEDRWVAPDSSATTGAATDEREQLKTAAYDQGLQVFEGTVRVMSGTELCEMEGVEPEMLGDPDVVAESSYAILVFDGDTTVEATYVDGGAGEKTTNHLGLGQNIPAYDFVEDTASMWLPYDGKRVCVAGDPWFPSDVSLPMVPRMTMGQILYYDE